MNMNLLKLEEWRKSVKNRIKHPMGGLPLLRQGENCHQLYQPGFEPATSGLLREYAIHYTTAAF